MKYSIFHQLHDGFILFLCLVISLTEQITINGKQIDAAKENVLFIPESF